MKQLKIAYNVIWDIKGMVSVSRATGCSIWEEAMNHLVPSLYVRARMPLRDCSPWVTHTGAEEQ